MPLYRRTMGVRSFVSLVSAVGLAACAFDEPNVGITEQGLGCDPDFCMTNSPLITHYGTWEFNVAGKPNGQGITVLGFSKGSDFYDLRVEDSRFVGYDAGGSPALTEADLIDAAIYLDIGGKQSAIVIRNRALITDVLSSNTLDTYVLDWGMVIGRPLPGLMHAGDTVEGGAMPVIGTTSNVCPEPKWYEEFAKNGFAEWDETIGSMALYEAVVFEGDRFDPETRTLAPKPDNDWFNIGCGAHTLAKLRLTRHTINTAPSWQHAQAALKMLSADYCGSGRSFTFSGEPLEWRDQLQPGMEYLRLGPTDNLEARWDENGAICVSDPRLMRTPNPAAATAYQTLWADIADECKAVGHRIRTCGDLDVYGNEGELITSVNHD